MKWLVLLVLPSLLMAAAPEDLSIGIVMTPQEEEAMGLNRATEAQRRAFETWVSSWTLSVIQRAPSYHPSLALSGWVRGWKKKTQQRPGVQKEEPLHIFRNQNGATITLNDGSVWNIIAMDRLVARWWRREELIQINKSERDLVRPYTLVNSTRDQPVGARLVSPATPEKKPVDDPSYFQGSVLIKSIGLQGTTITLEDGAKWKISPEGQQFVAENWKPNDRVRIEKSTDSLYRYKIINLDGGDEVLGNK